MILAVQFTGISPSSSIDKYHSWINNGRLIQKKLQSSANLSKSTDAKRSHQSTPGSSLVHFFLSPWSHDQWWPTKMVGHTNMTQSCQWRPHQLSSTITGKEWQGIWIASNIVHCCWAILISFPGKNRTQQSPEKPEISTSYSHTCNLRYWLTLPEVGAGVVNPCTLEANTSLSTISYSLSLEWKGTHGWTWESVSVNTFRE